MSRMRRVWAAGRALALSFLALGAAPQAAPADKDFETRVRPLLATYCFSCHGPKKKSAKVDLSAARGEAEIARAQETWLAAIQQLRTRAMPPEEAEKKPSEEERRKIVAWLEAAMDRIDARAPKDPGRVVVRRLNRSEYDNTIRDLVGIDVRPAENFPADDVSEGFDTLGEVLSLPPLLLEKYLDAAERVLDRALVADGPVPLLERRLEAETHLKQPAVEGVVELKFEQGFTAALSVPAEGRYEVRVRAGQRDGPDGRTIVVVQVDGVDMALVTIASAEPAVSSASFLMPAGERKVSFRHTPPKAYNKDEKVPDTRLFLDWVEVAGPERSLSHRRILGEGEGREAAKGVLERFARRAFRRPVAPDELGRPLALYDRGLKQGKSHAGAVRLALWSVLVSPHFLFRVERDSADRDDAGHVRLGDWELASRLSYLLWSTMPDDALFALAAKGRLRDPEVLRGELRRMLADPRSRALVDNFAAQWLGLRKLEHAHPDRELFPAYSDTLRRAMAEEATAFFANLLREDRSVVELVDADYTFLNEPLARLYGIKGVQGDAMRRVPLADRNRGGVITMAAILTLTSHPTRTSAVKRGKWILDEILGAPPPPPPPNVPELEEATKNRPDASTLSLKRKMELHRADPQCFGCHQRMDVLGLGLENYDPIGRWRDKEGGRKIEVAGTLPTGESFADPAGLKKVLAASRDDFARALAEKMLVYALGRPLGRGDRPVLKRIVEDLRKREYRVSALLEGVIMSYPFQYRRAAAGEAR
jgi:mono/diheme cytochrome c family protein